MHFDYHFDELAILHFLVFLPITIYHFKVHQLFFKKTFKTKIWNNQLQKLHIFNKLIMLECLMH